MPHLGSMVLRMQPDGSEDSLFTDKTVHLNLLDSSILTCWGTSIFSSSLILSKHISRICVREFVNSVQNPAGMMNGGLASVDRHPMMQDTSTGACWPPIQRLQRVSWRILGSWGPAGAANPVLFVCKAKVETQRRSEILCLMYVIIYYIYI